MILNWTVNSNEEINEKFPSAYFVWVTVSQTSYSVTQMYWEDRWIVTS